MPRSTIPPLLAAIFALLLSPAEACTFLLEDDSGPRIARLGDIRPGTTRGVLSCGARRHAVLFWTLAVDADKAEIGVRDGKLFDTRFTGPLTELMSARIENHVRVSVHERTETTGMPRSPMPAGRHSFRRFVTFCDLGNDADPLDCSVGSARIKARATATDSDRDGHPDFSLHEISLYDGTSRLHVMSFTAPFADSITAEIGTSIEAINAVSDVLRAREVASAD
ncbi:hypothetical protein [Oricola thermophila]|uniref:DUF1849 family protein n=1 Tax=Oricola thermophila TaxID=2742145 RepID=A0A6N1VL48_9HYPH|nr:hypothetical protein [Oricola thermophila]QKV19939.1 hypothetical protein HTY61_16515 [Oricola thermophila]